MPFLPYIPPFDPGDMRTFPIDPITGGRIDVRPGPGFGTVLNPLTGQPLGGPPVFDPGTGQWLGGPRIVDPATGIPPGDPRFPNIPRIPNPQGNSPIVPPTLPYPDPPQIRIPRLPPTLVDPPLSPPFLPPTGYQPEPRPIPTPPTLQPPPVPRFFPEPPPQPAVPPPLAAPPPRGTIPAAPPPPTGGGIIGGIVGPIGRWLPALAIGEILIDVGTIALTPVMPPTGPGTFPPGGPCALSDFSAANGNLFPLYIGCGVGDSMQAGFLSMSGVNFQLGFTSGNIWTGQWREDRPRNLGGIVEVFTRAISCTVSMAPSSGTVHVEMTKSQTVQRTGQILNFASISGDYVLQGFTQPRNFSANVQLMGYDFGAGRPRESLSLSLSGC